MVRGGTPLHAHQQPWKLLNRRGNMYGKQRYDNRLPASHYSNADADNLGCILKHIAHRQCSWGGRRYLPDLAIWSWSRLASNTALTLSTNSTNPASPVTLTAAVSSSAASVPATGTVTFYSGTTQIGTPQTLVNGQASIQYTFAAGTYSVTAVYGGSQFFFSSTSTPSSVTSVIPTFTLTPLQTTLTIAQGQTAQRVLH